MKGSLKPKMVIFITAKMPFGSFIFESVFRESLTVVIMLMPINHEINCD